MWKARGKGTRAGRYAVQHKWCVVAAEMLQVSPPGHVTKAKPILKHRKSNVVACGNAETNTSAPSTKSREDMVGR